MPFLFGVGYTMIRGAGTVARACGASEELQSEIRKGVAKIAVPLDPIGACLGTAHELAEMTARGGSETGRKIADALDSASKVDGAVSRLTNRSQRHP